MANLFLDHLELTKPRLTLLAASTALLGYVMASDHVKIAEAAALAIGSFLVGGGANALNQFLERDVDAKMRRTMTRPLPAGRLTPSQALVFGLAVSAAGLAVMNIALNTLTTLFAGATLLSYVLIYTPLKRHTACNTAVGAVAGALPILMGWAAAGKAPDLEAGMLFAFLYIWQLPHFYAIAWVYKEDYLNAGLRMPTLGDKVGAKTALHIVLFCLILVPASFLPVWAGMSGVFYFGAAFLAGAAFLTFAVFLFLEKLTHARRFVQATIVYMILIVATMMADKSWEAWATETPLPDYGVVEDFTLVEASGDTFSLNALKDRPWVGNFMFLHCPGRCPEMNLIMADLAPRLPRSARLVSFTVDPSRDNAETLAHHAANLGAEKGRWFFLTGKKEVVDRVLKSFHMNSTEDPGLHSFRFALVDGAGHIRGYYDSLDPEAVKNLARDAARLAQKK